MKKGTAIIAIVVVILLVGGGIAAAAMSGFFGGEKDKVSFDKNYFDLSGAKSLAIKQNSQTSSKVNAVSLSTGGSATVLIGDDSDDVVSTTFYKKTDSGWVKVKMYKDEAKGEEVSYDYSPLVMDVTDDGKFAFMVFGEMKKDSRDYRNVTYVIVSLVSGKIYELPDDTNHRVQFNSSEYNSTLKYYYTNLVNRNNTGCYYKYLGCTDSAIYLTTNVVDNVYHIFVATESNGELNFNEILSNEAMASNEIGNILFYKNGIMRVLYNDSNNHKESWVVFQNGYLKKCNEDELKECEGYLCTEVTYSNTYFPTSAKRIIGLSGSNFTTETVSYDTDEKSYNAAKDTLRTNQIFKKENANNTVIVLMNKVNKIQRLTLNNDCTSTLDEGIAVLTDDYKLKNLPGWTEGGGIMDDTSGGGGGPDRYYCIVNKHICQGTNAVGTEAVGKAYGQYAPSSTIVSDDGNMYLAVNDAVKKYNLLTDEMSELSVENLAEAKSLDADGDRIIVTGLSNQGKQIKGTLDFSTGKVDTSEQDILKEYTIKAVN